MTVMLDIIRATAFIVICLLLIAILLASMAGLIYVYQYLYNFVPDLGSKIIAIIGGVIAIICILFICVGHAG